MKTDAKNLILIAIISMAVGVLLAAGGASYWQKRRGTNLEYAQAPVFEGNKKATSSLTTRVNIVDKKVSDADESASIFPNTESKLTDGTAITMVTIEAGIQMPAVSRQVIAEFYDTATRADYGKLDAFLKERGFSIIGQIPDLYMVQIGVTSDDQIIPLVAKLKTLPYIEDAYPNMAFPAGN